MSQSIIQTKPQIRLQDVTRQLCQAARAHGRDPQDIKLVAVSKTKPVEAILALASLGQARFAENYVDEARRKIPLCDPNNRLEWHFIGTLQSNKTAYVARTFAWVHSLDRLKIARRLSAQRPQCLPDLNLCLQVNISGEASKSGVAPEQAFAMADTIVSLPKVRLRGLMAVPAPAEGFQRQLEALRPLRTLYDAFLQRGYAFDTLSMGMSADLDAAIAMGSTLVRIGTALFGSRN